MASVDRPATVETVRKLTGVPINFLVTVNFRGFKQVVSRMGGVWIDVDRRYFNDNSSGGERYSAIDLQPGYQKLNGEDALEYVRYRHLDSDFFRIARQQQFLRGIKQRATDFPLIDLPKLVKTLTSNVEVGKGDGTPLRCADAARLRGARLRATATPCDPDEDRPELLPGSERGHRDPSRVSRPQSTTSSSPTSTLRSRRRMLR